MNRTTILLFILLLVPGCRTKHTELVQSPVVAQNAEYLHPAYNPAEANANVANALRQVANSPEGAIGWSMLAAADLQICRETADAKYANNAEIAARRSLALRKANNGAAYSSLVSSLLTQHRFIEAKNICLAQLQRSPLEEQSATSLLEASIELGDYDRSGRLAAKIPSLAKNPYGNALLARLAEIRGNPERALARLNLAIKEADANYDTPVEHLAWFYLRLGNLLENMGQFSEAKQNYAKGLSLYPRDYRAMAGLARVAADLHEWADAEVWAKHSTEVVPLPETVGLLYDIYKAQGKQHEAVAQLNLYFTIAGLSRAAGNLYDRQYALFCADHNMWIGEAAATARRELLVRHDVYAYDTVAWCLYRAGEIRKAEFYAKKALAQGTQDAKLLYHAGVIASGAGDITRAAELLSKAEAISPHFHWNYADDARSKLAAMSLTIGQKR